MQQFTKNNIWEYIIQVVIDNCHKVTINMAVLMCTIKTPTSDYIFINCFILLTHMQHFIDFQHVGFEIFLFYFLFKNATKSESTKFLNQQLYFLYS